MGGIKLAKWSKLVLWQGDSPVNRVLLQVLVGVFAFTSLCMSSHATVKVHGDLGHIKTVAVVGYSFYRDVQIEEPSLTKFKREVIPLTKGGPEYNMMQVADDRVMSALQTLGPFTVMPREEVLANEFYQSETKDPAKKLMLNWYFPKGYREVKLKKKSAIALAEALGVDAVILIELDSTGHTERKSYGDPLDVGYGDVYATSTKIIQLKGEITMFDSSGKELISGKTKSDKLDGATTQSWGSAASGGEGGGYEREREAPKHGNVYQKILDSFMERLNRQLEGG